MTGLRAAIAAVPIALAFAGCADPYTQRADSTPTPASTPPTAAPKREPAARVARAFAKRWINWDWRTASRQQRALARLAADKLAGELRANAASAQIDARLTRDRPGSRGSVVIIRLRTRAARAGGLVVTREQTYTDGHADLGGRRYRVYRIALTRSASGWEVSGWRPQP